MKCQRMKKYFYIGLSAFMSLYLSLCSCIGSYASETTTSGSSDEWEMDNRTFLENCWLAYARFVSGKYVLWHDLTGCTFSGFDDWYRTYDNGDHYYKLDSGYVVGHGGGGYSRPSDKINNSTDVTVEPELQQDILTYVQECTTQTSLGYTECYIYSYNFLSPSPFVTYSMYKSAQELIKQNDGYSIIMMTYNNGQALFNFVNRYQDVGLVGTVVGGSFTNGTIYVNWGGIGNGTQKAVNSNGSVQDYNSNWGSPTVRNGATPSNSYKIIMSNQKHKLIRFFLDCS